jgi:hypothetical protein
MSCLQQAELAARIMAHGCNVYSSNKDSEHDQRIKATRSAATSAACGERWMAARAKLRAAGLDPLATNEPHDAGQDPKGGE